MTKNISNLNHRNIRGFSLIELLISMAIGVFITGAALSVFVVQSKSYKTTTSQSGIQNIGNAISAMVVPVIRSSGFNGCSNMTQSQSNLNNGGPAPLGTQSTTSSMLIGYDANGTAGDGSAFTLSSSNPANSGSAADWSSSLESTLVGQVQKGSDVIVLLGAIQNSEPIGVTSIPFGSDTIGLQDTTGLSAGQFGIISDCLKSTIFKITSVSANSIKHHVGSGPMNNIASSLSVNYPIGTQFVPLQQTAFFVGKSLGGQSSLMRAIYANSQWTVEPLIPGVESMQVLYGTGSNGIASQYMTANSISDWTKIASVRLGFLVQGQSGSGMTGSTGSRQFNVLGTVLTVPDDGRLRHVYEITINMRNAA
jgi:type IV pilus assembly protein PilW